MVTRGMVCWVIAGPPDASGRYPMLCPFSEGWQVRPTAAYSVDPDDLLFATLQAAETYAKLMGRELV